MSDLDNDNPDSNDPDATRYMGVEDEESDGSEMTDLTGRTFDDFRILRKLGAGGMASVYLADQMSLGRRVAIKLMSPVLAGNDADSKRSLARFRTEAMAAAALTHPNIVQVYTVGQSEGLPYIAMEYVPGRNLSELVRRQGPLKVKMALHVIRQAARALSAAHTAGVVHRDIKPANILVSPGGDVKVADFGLSQLTAGPEISAGLTQTGTTVGTPRYMSPEQIEGRPVDARSDLYSLGITLFYVLAGRPPFDSPSPMVLASQHLRDAPPLITEFRADTPDVVVELIQSLLEKAPDDRLGSANDVVRELGSILGTLKAGDFDDHSLAEISSVRSTSSASAIAPVKNAARSTTSRLRPFAVGFAACLVGLGSAAFMKPGDPLRGSVEVEKRETVRDQFVAAMMSGRRSDFLAVEKYWPEKTDWVRRAKVQRLLGALADSGRTAEANQLIDSFRASSSRELELIATVAQVVLLTNEGKIAFAERAMPRSLDSAVSETLDPVWQNLWSEARERVANSR